MTYCVGLRLDRGIVFASDTRTNAGFDNVADLLQDARLGAQGRPRARHDDGRQSRLHAVGREPAEREGRTSGPTHHSLGDTHDHVPGGALGRRDGARARRNEKEMIEDNPASLRRVLHPRRPDHRRASAPLPDLPGGQFHRGDQGHRLFPDRRAQIRQADPRPRRQAATCAWAIAAKLLLISFDSTLRSNLSVGMPIDLLIYRKDELKVGEQRRIEERDPYFRKISAGWSQAIRDAFAHIDEYGEDGETRRPAAPRRRSKPSRRTTRSRRTAIGAGDRRLAQRSRFMTSR